MAEESRSHFKPNVPESEFIPNNVKKQKTTELSNPKNEDSKNDTKIETEVKHQGGRPSVGSHNKCHLCDKAFKTKGTLGQHLIAHTYALYATRVLGEKIIWSFTAHHIQMTISLSATFVGKLLSIRFTFAATKRFIFQIGQSADFVKNLFPEDI